LLSCRLGWLLNERASKAPKTSFGKGGSAKRAHSSEPSRSSDDEEVNTQGGNARMCHLILEHPAISSRLQAAAMSFVASVMPQLLSSNARVDFKSKSKWCYLTVVCSGECSMFVNQVYCLDEPMLSFKVAGKDEFKMMQIKRKHDEPYESRQNKFRISKHGRSAKPFVLCRMVPMRG
jgi:hypothetical protein